MQGLEFSIAMIAGWADKHSTEFKDWCTEQGMPDLNVQGLIDYMCHIVMSEHAIDRDDLRLILLFGDFATQNREAYAEWVTTQFNVPPLIANMTLVTTTFTGVELTA
ncbi:hypothetical protein [Streptomyces sp. A1-5]|uniref:hypothetical protein n=1 Tax=Streptomyces sp. A1-5 TaxID=2738410 RepID=UPI001F1805AA|nr:hypothetical protein [Streptomyces sp. A1-5]UJB45726.1 hypothetical protein HRD51_37560 [Streptomyces sp. A1-5]